MPANTGICPGAPLQIPRRGQNRRRVLAGAPSRYYKAVFDQNTIFQPGYYGVGFIQDPIADGSGIVGDFASANPKFAAANLVSTTFSGYRGAGVSAGVHIPPGSGPLVEARPITLRQGGDVFLLRLADRTEEFSQGAPLHSVSLTAIPEPGTLALASVTLAGLVALRLRRYLI